MNKLSVKESREQMICLAMSVLMDTALELSDERFNHLMQLLNSWTGGRLKSQAQINILKILNQ